MSVLNTQSVLAQRFDEKEQKLNAKIEVADNFATQSTPPQRPAQNAELMSEQVGDGRTNTALQNQNALTNAPTPFLSDDYTPEQIEFALAFSKESDELLKNGASKKKMVDFLREQDILDAQTWDILNKESGGDDELLFDFFKQNADRIRNTEYRTQMTEHGQQNAEDGQQKTPPLPENKEDWTDTDYKNYKQKQKEKFKNLKDLSELEKEFHNPTFKTWLETTIKQGAQRALSLAVGTDEWLKNDADKDIAFNIREKIQQGASKEDFTPLEKWYMSNEMQNINWQRATALTDTSEFSLKNRKQSIKASFETDENVLFEQNYKERKALDSAMKKQNRADLNEEEARAYERYAGINTLFGDENDEFEKRKKLYNAEFVIVPQMQKNLAFLKNIHENESFSNQFFFKDEKLKTQYENALVDFALGAGFDGVAKNDENGDTYFIKDGKEYLVNEGFFDNFFNVLNANKGAIAGGMAGAIQGAKKGGVKGSVIGAAAGSFFGAGADTLLTNYVLDRENSASELIRHSVEEGLLSVVSDGVIIGLGKGVKYLAQNNKKLVEQGKTALNWIGDNTLFVGLTRNVKTQNIRGAENVVAMDSELKKGIDEAYKLYGGRVGIDETHFLQGGADKIKAKFGENSTEARLAQGLVDIMNLRNLKDRQSALVEYIRADESGRALGFLVEVASRSPIVQQNLKIILNKTSADLTRKLENLGIRKIDIKKVYDDLEQATEASYNEAMDGILAKLYPKDIEKYRASIDTQPFEDLIAQFRDEKTLIDDASKIFKKDIIDALFSGEKLSFTQLNNIRKNLNTYTRALLEKRPSFQNTLTLQLQKELRNAIDNAIKDIFRQNPVAFSKASELYETALKDYANMKNTLKVIDELKASNAKTWEENAVKALINFAKGQGDDMTNLARLTQHLAPENRAVVEMNILQQLFEKSRFVDEMTNIDVFDSGEFLKKLSKLTGKDGEKAVFESAQAKELINMVNDFHTLFKKDADIARHLSPARTNNPTGTPNMATSMSGKVNMTRVKLLWEFAIRNLPDMFWLPKTWREGIKGAALRYHLHHALSRSGSISEFRQNFSEAVKRIPHTTNAQKVIKEMNKAFDEMENLSKDLAKMSDDELIKKEMKDTFGVVYEGQNSALIYKDLQNIQNAILLQKGDKNKGATHIRLNHTLDNNQQGFVTPDEVQNIGQNVRKYLKEHKEPFIDTDGARLYEWQDEKGVNFRLVARDKVSGADTLPTSANEEIITFYSNRNLKDGINFSFKNPQVAKTAKKAQTLSQGYEPSANSLAKSADENIIPNSSVQSQAPQKSLLDKINTQKAVLASKQKHLENLNKQAEMTYLDPYAFRVEKAQLELDIAQRQKKINDLENKISKEINDLPTKSTLEKPLQPAEIKQSIDKWDLNNPSPNDKILISKVQGDELEQLKKEFDFKGNYALAREIEAKNVKHALTQHGDEAKEAARGQIAITKDDIANYQQFTQKPDLRIVQDNNRIIYAKQINGYYVVVEEVLTGQNKLQFFDMWKGKGKINKEVLLSHSQRPKHDFEPNFNRHMPSNTDEIIPNSSVQSQAPQKSLLDLAREETERLRQAQIDKELAQKEAEIARLKEMKAQQEQIIAQKESKAGLSANEAQRLEIGESIPTKLIKPTKIIINDSAEPFEAEFVIAKKSDIKPNFERTGTQGRSEKQGKVIDSIQSDFKPHLIFEQSGGFEGLPIITKDGQVIAGNHRAEAINALSGQQLAKYKQAAKEKFGVDLADDEVIVRLVADENERDLINLAFMSNVGRESNLGEKALSNLAKFEKEMSNLPNHIKAESVDELQSIISKTLDKEGSGLNTFDTNLALFSKLAKNSKNNDILEALNQIQNLSAEEKSKILKMFVDNAGSFYNLAKDSELKNLDLRPYLNDSLVVAAKSYATRAEDYARLLADIEHILSLSEVGLKETLKLDKNLFENLKSKALGLSLARFARLENPSSQLFDFLKNAKANLEELNSANLFDSTGKKLDELDIYDFLKHSIAQGRESDDALKIIGKLDELRAVEKKALKNADDELFLREKFGENYPEFKGNPQKAIERLVQKQSGQVQGAFFSENLAKKTGNGEVDLVFGDENMGLSHILKKHGDEFTQFKGDTQAEKIANALSEIIKKGKIIERGSDKINIEYNGFLVGLNKGFDGVGKNRWIVTAYDNTISITEKNAKRSPAGDFTGKTPLSPNSVENIIPNSSAKSQILAKISEDIEANAKKYTDISNEMKEINLKRMQLGNSGFSFTQNEKMKKLSKKLKPIEREIRRLETLKKHFNGELDKDFFSKLSPDTLEWYKKAIEKYDKENIAFAKGRKNDESVPSLFSNEDLAQLKDIREVSLSQTGGVDEIRDFFRVNNKDKMSAEIFEKTINVAKKLGVKVRFSAVAERSSFEMDKNLITIATSNAGHFQAQDLLHELIHSTTRKGLKLYKENKELAKTLYTQRQIEAFEEIESLYTKSKQIAQKQGQTDIYAHQSVDEFVAELSSSEFRKVLKAQDLFEKVIRAIIRFFYGESKDGVGAVSKNSFEELKKAYYKILDEYEPPLASQKRAEVEKIQIKISDLKAQKNELYTAPKSQAVKNAPQNSLFDDINTTPKRQGENQINKKEIIAQKIDIVDEFEEKQFTLWNSELHKELKNLQDEIDKTLGKNLGLHSADLSDDKIMNAVSALRYDVFAKLFNEAKLPYESCKKLKELIKKGKEVDFNDRELSPALNKFENPLLFIQNYANTKLPAPFRDNLFQKIEKIFKNVEKKSQENIEEFKKALNNKGAFDSTNPNILQANQHLGAGLLGGTINGIETDENGNVIGFSPEKFIIGFLGGAGASKALNSQFVKKYATITSDKIKKSVQNSLQNLVRNNEKVLLQNPQGFIKELDKKGIAELLNSKGNIKMSVADGLKVETKPFEYQTLKNTFLSPFDETEKHLNEAFAVRKSSSAENLDRIFAAQKTARIVDNYAKTAKFKILSNEKQQAILSLKDIKPSQMPDELVKTADFENVVTHFDKKLDKEQRNFYLKLFDLAKKEPDLVLESAKNENLEYIKAFQHTQTKDLYYLAFTQKNGITKITGIPTTQIRKVIKDIAQSKKVLNAEDLGGIKETAKPTLKSPSPQLVDEIIPKIQNKFKQSEQWAKNLFEWHKDSSPLTKEADGTPKVFYHATNADEKFEIFDKNKIHSGYGFWFGDDIKSQAVQEAKTGNAPIYKVFLKMKKPFEVLEPINKDNYKEFEKIFNKNFEKELENNEKIAKFEAFVKKELEADEVDIDVVNFLWSVKKNGVWKDYRGNKLYEIVTPKIQKEAQKYLDEGVSRKITYNYLPRAYDKVGQKEAEQVKQRLISNGYDGIKYGDEYVVFDSNQIKSVDNKGAFDSTNPNILQANQHLGAGLLGGTINGIETDENGNVIGFSPEKFIIGFLGGAGASKALTHKAVQNPKIKAGLEKFATMQRIKAKKENKMHYDTLTKIDKSPNFGSKMELIGKENLNAEVLKYALIKNKRIAVNKLDENTAKMLNFHYPHDVRRTIQPNEVEHTLQRHGVESNLVKFSGQKPVTLDDIAKYQDYADSAEIKQTSQDKKKNNVLVSLKQLDNEFIVVVEQVRKIHNELGFKTMYFEKGVLDEETIERLTSSKRKGA